VARERLEHRRQDTYLTGVRGASHEKLPAAERGGSRKLSADVDRLLARVPSVHEEATTARPQDKYHRCGHGGKSFAAARLIRAPFTLKA
jgi:hypothetical protein